MICHLRTHSSYSLLEALPSPRDLAQAAANAGMPAVALTDRHNLTGAVEFVQACHSVGVRPIVGLQLTLGWPEGIGEVTLLAADQDGWQSLCGLATDIQFRPQPDAPCWPEMLTEHNAGLICLAGSQGGQTPLRWRQLADWFSGRLYAAISRFEHEPVENARYLADLAARTRLPVAALQPVYYLAPEQAGIQRLLTAIRTNRPLSRLPDDLAAPPGAYFLTPKELETRLSDLPQALAGACEVVDRCQAELPLGKTRHPHLNLPNSETPLDCLRKKAEEGARERYGQLTPALRQRLDHELETIAAKEYETVFLIVEEILSYARQRGIPFSSRGSAASSLVAHCLGITSPDPIRLDLYFERFLNPARTTPPDIDTDLCSRRRTDVIQHVFETYGHDRVAMVATINRYRPRSALIDAAKAYGVPQRMIRTMAESLPHAFFHRLFSEGGESARSPFSEMANAYSQYRRVFRDAEALLDLPRHLSVHPGGLVVAPGPLNDFVPLQTSGSKRVVITQVDLKSVEALGLIKIDLLGIRGLTVLGDVADAVYSWRRSEFQHASEVFDSIPTADPATADTIEQAKTIGCFQIESPGMRSTLREIRARSIDDVMAALALYRPGPLKGGLRDRFVARIKGEESVEHIHPALAPLVEDTYGVILYQEQVLRIVHQLAGLPLADADLLRRAMSHFDPGKRMQAIKQRFITGAQEKSGVPLEIAEQIWELMAAFAGYGFPKAHAASYAEIAWRSAWCKTHVPAEFMAAVLANWGGYYSQRVYLTEARRMGLQVRPPHVNHSQREFCAVYPDGEPVLYMGLDQVRALTRRTISRILDHRPYRSLEEFLVRVDPRAQELENLALAGALTGLATIPQALTHLQSGRWQPGQLSLFTDPQPDGEEWDIHRRVAAQEQVLGISPESHPLELRAAEIEASEAISTVDAAGRIGQRVCVAGMRQSSHRSRTVKGDTILFLTLEDLEGTLEVIIFSRLYRQSRQLITTQAILLITGTVEIDSSNGEPVLHAEQITRLS